MAAAPTARLRASAASKWRPAPSRMTGERSSHTLLPTIDASTRAQPSGCRPSAAPTPSSAAYCSAVITVSRTTALTSPPAISTVEQKVAGRAIANETAMARTKGTESSHCTPYIVRTIGCASTIRMPKNAQPAAATYDVALMKVGFELLPSRAALANIGIATAWVASSTSRLNIAARPLAREYKPTASKPCTLPSTSSGTL